MLLASLTTSSAGLPAAAAAAARGGPGASSAGSAGGRGPVSPFGDARGSAAWLGVQLPQISIQGLPGPRSFVNDQELAAEVLAYHTAKHGGFPRPCLACGSAEFMTPLTPSSTTATSSSSAPAAGPPSPAAAPGGLVSWPSRPMRCEACQAWTHFGCLRVRCVEDVPPGPWFHCPSCRNSYLRLEALAAGNPHPSSASPAHSLYFMTPSDLHAYRTRKLLRALGLDLAEAPGGGPPAARGPMGAVLRLLAQGFSPAVVQGFGDAAREYDGGRYSALLLHNSVPVSAATFNVFGTVAQLNLLSTADICRGEGHGSALAADVEGLLQRAGVRRVVVQPRGKAMLGLWESRLGYRCLLPEEAEELHSQVPVAYYDCGILSKDLA